MSATHQTVDEYLKAIPAGRREALDTLRALILETVPGVKETMRYRMPTYELGQVVCSFASQKHYMSLYMDTELVARHKAELQGLDTGKSCIRFRRIEALPLDTIRQILRETVAG